MVTTSFGVAAGASKPNHVPIAMPGTPDSCSVGTLGKADERLAVVTANGFNLPSLMKGNTGVTVSNDMSTWPPNKSVVNAKSPYNSVKELVAVGKATPDKLAYGSNGNGTAQHMIGTQFQWHRVHTSCMCPTKVAHR